MVSKPLNPDNADQWSEWLLQGRHGGDPDRVAHVQSQVNWFRDRVLDGAELKPGMSLVDVGTGDGLIAFGAFARVGSDLTAICVDVSKPLLEHVEQRSIEMGLRDRCSFVESSAETLTGVADTCADVVTTRAVLAYVPDKASAARNFYRVLKPGGRVSLAEPIDRDEAVNVAAFSNFLLTPAGDRTNSAVRLLHRCRSVQMPSSQEAIATSPLTNFSERSLVTHFQNAGFDEIHLELHIDIRNEAPISWETYINIAPRPGAPTLREVFTSLLTVAEQLELEANLRPLVESGKHKARQTTAYLTATKAL